jgi:phosphoribosylaminoimidazole carboxylase PurE protein
MDDPRIAIIMGSRSDGQVMQAAEQVLQAFGVPYELKVLSAHRTPEETRRYVQTAEERGLQVIIAAAGFAAHLAGFAAAHTILPIIGVPIDSSPLQGVDSLYSTVQMPGGVPVATMSIGKAGAKNAALFAVQILSRQDPELVSKLKRHREEMRADVLNG